MLAESPKHVDSLVIEIYASILSTRWNLTENSHSGNTNHPNYLKVADEPVSPFQLKRNSLQTSSRLGLYSIQITFVFRTFIKHWWFSGKIGRCQ
jgi:hypothetical protein